MTAMIELYTSLIAGKMYLILESEFSLILNEGKISGVNLHIYSMVDAIGWPC